MTLAVGIAVNDNVIVALEWKVDTQASAGIFDSKFALF
jgi:hypothetical protein